MKLTPFLDKVIEEGVAAAKRDYAESPMKLKGAVAGFEACRGKTIEELRLLLNKAHDDTQHAFHRQTVNYWETRCFEAEVSWVCNVVSAGLYVAGLPTIVSPTMGALKQAIRINDSEPAEQLVPSEA